MKGKVFVMILLLCVATVAHTEPTVWYVHLDSVLHSIQDALDSCADNDIVLVGPGTYVENIVWPNTQGIHLISELGPEATIIDGNSAGAVIIITPSVDSMTVIRGFTIQNGHGSYDPSGGGISCSGSVKIMENIITHNNSAVQGGGGGIGINNCSPVIIDNLVTDNRASSGGGICGYGDTVHTVTMIGNTITNNEAYGWSRPGNGSAIACHNAVLQNNIISENFGNCFSSIHCGYVTIDSCTISYNTGAYRFSAVSVTNGNSLINHCNIFGNDWGVETADTGSFVNAEYNWWGDASGPYHPSANPGGLGDTVSDYVDFIPWLDYPVGVEQKDVIQVERRESSATIFSGPLLLPEGNNCRVFDITGRVVAADKMRPGIHFIEIDGRIAEKVVKVK